MKFIKQLFLIAVCGLFVTSCADEPLPFVTFDELEHGAFARKLTDDGGTFFFTDPDGSAFAFSVEFFDENNGNNIASHDWYVWHRDNVAGTVTDKVLLLSTPASSFGTDPTSGLPNASYAFSMNEAIAALGLTIDDMNGGDDLIFDGIIVMNNGSEFGPDNSGSSLQGNNGFDGVFRFQKPLLCVSSLDGVYDLTATSAGTAPWNIGVVTTGTIRFEQVGDGVYDIYTTGGGCDIEFLDASMGAYFGGWSYDPCDASNQGSMPNDGAGNGNVQLVDACNKLSWSGSSQWGEVYSFNSITVNGSNLIIDWINDYGEGGVASITRTDGTPWPALK